MKVYFLKLMFWDTLYVQIFYLCGWLCCSVVVAVVVVSGLFGGVDFIVGIVVVIVVTVVVVLEVVVTLVNVVVIVVVTVVVVVDIIVVVEVVGSMHFDSLRPGLKQYLLLEESPTIL